MSLQLIVDVREKALMSELTNLGASFTATALDVGDVAIQDAEGAPLLVAERKSLADFAASNSDGRYREQRARLMALRGGGTPVVYFLEGRWRGDPTALHGFRTTEDLLKRLTSRLTLRYGLPVIMTADIRDTAQWCMLLMRQLAEDVSVFSHEAAFATAMGGFTEAISAVKRSNRGAESVATGMLSAVAGLGGKRATGLAAAHSIAALCEMDADELAGLVVSGKRLGAKVGAALYEALHGPSTVE
jgi:ERCC4-type nuclease